MILTIAHTKGGVGKSTIALQIGIGIGAAMLDGDTKQRTLRKSVASRPATLRSVICEDLALKVDEAQRQVARLAKQAPHVVIDAGGHDAEGMRVALLLSDVVLIPATATNAELWSFAEMLPIVAKARTQNADLRAFGVVNRAKARGTTNSDAASAMRGMGLDVLDAPISQLGAWDAALGYGMSVMEAKPVNHKAREELARIILKINDINTTLGA